ncbi:high nitrogen upregulated cytochrome P450 monooxygenase 2 [Mycena amicta]|nr:high nitrogen upregulated cytochrome P450 monooxygenase 2 [Mycena amicta]
MALNPVVVSAILAALVQPSRFKSTAEHVLPQVNHSCFQKYEPKTAHYPLLALLIQPPVLVLLLRPPTSTGWNVLIAIVVFLATLGSSIVVYRLSPWHPLAHIPGPTLAKISKLWSVKLALKGNKHRVFKQLHERYGDFVRTGPNEVSIIHSDAIKTVLGTGGFQKGQYYELFSDPTLGTRNLLTLHGDAHANRRRIWNRGMSSDSLKGYEGILAHRVALLLEQLDEFASLGNGTVNIAEWFSYFAVDFMGDMAFGGGFEMLRDGGDRDGTFSVIKSGLKRVATAIMAHIPWLGPTVEAILGANGLLKRLRRLAQVCAKNRIASGPKETTGKDLWYHLMDEEGHEKVKPTVPEVVVDGVLAIVAGSDTTSMALSSFIWCMMSNPDIYARARAEVDAVYADAEAILDSGKHGELQFVTACIQESLRLYPPLPTGGPRKVPAGPARLVAGKFIPENTQIYLPPYVIHRSPKHFFPAPDKYDPERWLRPHSQSESDSETRTLNHSTFLPFSYGAANCAGKHLAWRELIMTVSALLKRYDMRFVSLAEREGKRWVDTIEDFFVTEAGKLMVEISVR